MSGLTSVDHEILTPEDAAELLRLSPAQIYELSRNRSRSRHAHPIPVCRVGKRLRFRRSALLTWLSALESAQ